MPKEKISDYWWLKPPDFEVRCDAFVDEVNKRVIPKYPKLQIEVENHTKEELAKLPRIIAMVEEFRNGTRLLERMKGEDRWEEELSATENSAIVDITGEGGNFVVIMAEAIEDIAAIAEIHGGKRFEISGYSIENDLLDSDCPGIFLMYVFS